MTLLHVLVLLLQLLGTLPPTTSSSRGSPEATPPNVVLLVVDDAGYDDFLSSTPPLSHRLPHISSLAERGATFTHTYITAPQCSPSRAAILTGMYQNRFGHETNAEFLAALSLNTTKILPQYLPTIYRSAMIGKWNLGDIPNSPLKHGFNEMYLYRNCEEIYGSHMKGAASKNLRHKPHLRESSDKDRRYCTSLMFERAVTFISSHSNCSNYRNLHKNYQCSINNTIRPSSDASHPHSPYFLYLAPLSPHPPFIYPPTYQSYFDSLSTSIHVTKRKVMTMMREIDDGLGHLLGALDAMDSLDNTVILFLSDNGAPDIFGVPDGYHNKASNFPFRGHKGDLLEGGIHTKLLLQWPLVIKAQQVVTTPISSLDLLPTIWHATSQNPLKFFKTADNLDGISLLSHLQLRGSGTIPINVQMDRVLYWRFNASCRAPKRALLQGTFKWHSAGDRDGKEVVHLYNLKVDENETNNLATTPIFKDLVHSLGRLHATWEKTLPPIHVSVSSDNARKKECMKRQQQAERNKATSKIQGSAAFIV